VVSSPDRAVSCTCVHQTSLPPINIHRVTYMALRSSRLVKHPS
jgi:hypothetical protein